MGFDIKKEMLEKIDDMVFEEELSAPATHTIVTVYPRNLMDNASVDVYSFAAEHLLET